MWPLPIGDKPGEWTEKIANVELCKRGYHLTERPWRWLVDGCRVYTAEGRGAMAGDEEKSVHESGRLLRDVTLSDRDLRLFAADCAEHVLHLYEQAHPGDERPRRAIEAAREYAALSERSAARAAARAAESAAWAAARSAESAARSAALSAARSAARSAESAAWAAARSAARSAAEVAWQKERWAWYVARLQGRGRP
jgi:hypothetical protein